MPDSPAVPAWMWWLGAGATVAVLALGACLPALVARLPVDVLVRPARARHGTADWARFALRNLAALGLAALGVALLVLPGQGLATLVLALMVADYPAKRRHLRWLAARRGVSTALDALRRRAGKAPLLR